MWLTHMTLHSAIIIMLKGKVPRVRIKAIIIDLMVKESRTMAKAKALKERKVKDNLLKVPKEGKELKAKPP
jgi:hypothetical protein